MFWPCEILSNVSHIKNHAQFRQPQISFGINEYFAHLAMALFTVIKYSSLLFIY
jgi:hypothetical protein